VSKSVEELLAGNEAKCNQRRKLAALRDGIEGAGVTLYKSGSTGPEMWQEGQLLHARGELYLDADEALERINSTLSGGKQFKKDDVFLHYMEAANSSFVNKYQFFLDATTLRNLADRGNSGMAFMNSHRTGGISTPAELPYGKTFTGRYEELEAGGVIHRRALLGVYMLKDAYPNGKMYPSTNDLHDAIQAGTLTDVSIGLNGGERICDVCARDLGDKDCNHIPGTSKGLSPEQMEAQKARGVPGGKASYTVVNGNVYEVSAVFKGAVPGAGFRKAISLGKAGHTDRALSQEVLSAYGSMMDAGDFKLFDQGKPKMKLSDVLRAVGLAQSAGIELEDLSEDDLASLKTGTQVPQQHGSKVEDTTLAADRAEVEAEKRQVALERFQHQADLYVTPLKSDGRVAGTAADALSLLYTQVALDDKFNPIQLELGGKKVTRLEVLKASNEGRQKSVLLSQGDLVGDDSIIPDGQKALPPSDDPKPTGESELSETAMEAYLAMTDHGKAALAQKKK
jgi:hypothetical protein